MTIESKKPGKKPLAVKQEPAVIDFDDLIGADTSGSSGLELLETKPATIASGRPTRSTRTTKNLNFDALYGDSDEDETMTGRASKGKGKAAKRRGEHLSAAGPAKSQF